MGAKVADTKNLLTPSSLCKEKKEKLRVPSPQANFSILATPNHLAGLTKGTLVLNRH